MGLWIGMLLLIVGLAQAQPQSAEEATAVQEDGEDAEPERQFRPRRFWPIMGGMAVADVVTLYTLNKLWYSDGGQTSFDFYSSRLETRYPQYEGDGWLDDWYTYKQQDKLGHVFVAWELARVFGEYGRWTGMSNEQAGLFGGTVSALFQSQIEILDGFARDYGFSRTDVLANVVGGTIGGLKVAYPERLSWFTAKYSYHPSPYYDGDIAANAVASYLGNVLKDYDGISYWLVIRPEELLRGASKKAWPDWLAFSIGHSADGLAHPISGMRESRFGPGPASEHHRQLFLSIDLDFATYIDRLPQPYRAIAGFFSFIRIPAPALEYGRETRWHWIYY